MTKRKKRFQAKFAYIYNQSDYENKIINFKVDNDKFFVGHNFLKTGTSLILINQIIIKKLILKYQKKLNIQIFIKF